MMQLLRARDINLESLIKGGDTESMFVYTDFLKKSMIDLRIFLQMQQFHFEQQHLKAPHD